MDNKDLFGDVNMAVTCARCGTTTQFCIHSRRTGDMRQQISFLLNKQGWGSFYHEGRFDYVCKRCDMFIHNEIKTNLKEITENVRACIDHCIKREKPSVRDVRIIKPEQRRANL